ncbi:hypothetical protein [Leptolyngbya sp. FACHB-16]|uniref:hypothetical protein n=1 Tax=unclassified Leptolyngbya TaxID=2650499 RepID=UPI0016836567|nr:hypothetical protein [Leptolyngbya sp. FACHB-16]MBD2153152.1 hypothetical protein [Leptolyngbya sp. FACHB-16]
MSNDYVRKQIQRLDTLSLMNNPAAVDDCLYRIASHLDLILPGEQVTDANRSDFLAWVERNRDVYTPDDGTAAAVLDSLLS